MSFGGGGNDGGGGVDVISGGGNGAGNCGGWFLSQLARSIFFGISAP